MLSKHTVESSFEWIETERFPLGNADSSAPDWKGITVANLIPSVFDAYAKIFHRIDVRFDWLDKPLAPDEIAILKIPSCSELEKFANVTRSSGSTNTRVRWKAVADALALPFVSSLTDEWFRHRVAAGCWPRYFYGPPDGLLEEEDMNELVRLLNQQSSDERCFMRLPYFAFVGTNEILLYEGALDDVHRLCVRGARPEYWWPISKQWCVCSDYDLTFTIVGGTRQCIDRILTSDLLESVSVTPSTRVDIKTPIPAL